jgi:hypothetical protein
MFSILLHIHCGFRLEFKASYLYSFGCAFRIVIKLPLKELEKASAIDMVTTALFFLLCSYEE